MRDRIARHQPGTMRSADRVHGEGGAHVRRDRVADHFPATQIHDRGQIQPPFAGREAADVSDQLQSGHRRTEVSPDQVRNHGRAGIRLGQVPAPTSGNAGDAAFASRTCGSATERSSRVGRRDMTEL
jgi:hypothetical protein